MITCKIYGQNGFQKQSNTLLDLGAQISLICEDRAAALGLKGNDTPITLLKVGGGEGTIKTEVYKVPVSSLDNTRCSQSSQLESCVIEKKCQQSSLN